MSDSGVLSEVVKLLKMTLTNTKEQEQTRGGLSEKFEIGIRLSSYQGYIPREKET